MSVLEPNTSLKEHKKVYFYLEEVNDVECVLAQCEKCFKENGNKGWQWVGDYGSSKIICKCGELLNEGNNKNN